MRGWSSILILALLLIPANALAMPQALLFVGSMILKEHLIAGLIMIVVGTVWGQAEQRKKLREIEAAQRFAYNSALKDRLATVTDTEQPLWYVYGEDVVVGSRVVDVLTTGDRDQYHHLVCVHADHESDAILDVAINGKWLGALDADGFVTQGDFLHTFPVDETEYHNGPVFNLAHPPIDDSHLHITRDQGDNEVSVPFTLNGTEVTVATSNICTCSYQWQNSIPRVRVKKRLGAPDTPADADTIAECLAYAQANNKDPEYTATCTLDEKTATIIRLDNDNDELRGGLPRVLVRMNGKKLHDVRDPSFPNDVPVCSGNNTLVIADYLTSPMCKVPWTDLPLADYIAAANACDIDKSFGKLYTLKGLVRSDQRQDQVLQSMVQSMAGSICANTWSIKAGVWTAPVMALDQSDIVGDFSYTAGSSDADLFNGVKGLYLTAGNNYVPTDFKPYQNAVYVAADGKELWQDINFLFTEEITRIHNICRILTEDQRNAFTINAEFSHKAWKLEPGDRVTFTSEFLGQTDKIYRVVKNDVGVRQAVSLAIKEDAESIWDLADAQVEDSTPNTNIPNPFAIAPLASISCSSGTDALLRQADGTIISRILVQWPLATTQTVVHGGYIEVEWQRVGAGVWQKVQVTGDETQVYLSPVSDGRFYKVRARCVNPEQSVKSNWKYAVNHQVVGKTERPSAVSMITATPDLLGVTLNWEEIPDPDRMDYLVCDDTGGAQVWNAYAGSAKKLPASPAGLHTYRIVSRDTSKLTSLTEATFQLTINAPSAPTLNAQIKDGVVELTWNDCTATHQIKHYELRYGADYETGTYLARSDSRSMRITPNWTGTRQLWLAGVDIAENTGNAGNVPVNITVPAAPTVNAEFVGDSVKLTWNKPSSFLPVDMWEVRYGSTWAGGTSLGKYRTTSMTLRAAWLGTRNLMVAAIDIAGNTGTPGSTEVNIVGASAPAITTEVIDNNALLRWTAVQGTLPTKTYEIRRGDVFATATVLGTKNGTFDIAPETAAGTYTYWIVAIDSAGNYGTPGSASATVSQPPDYILRSDIDSDFSGTKSNMGAHGDGSWIAPINTTETVAEHFTNNSWATPQDQINAGYPIYIQPNNSPAYYEEVVDYGVVLAGTRITVTLMALDLVGAVAKSCKISVSANGVDYVDYDGVWQVYATAFRYVKYRVTFTASNGTDLLEIETLNFRLDVKRKAISIPVSFDAADSGGTIIYLTDDGTATGNKLFIDVEGITLQPYGTARRSWVVDFSDVPNPLSCKLFVWDESDNRVSGSGCINVGGS